MGFAAFRGHPVPEPDIGEPMAVGGGHAVLAARFTPLEGILAGSRTTSPWPLPPCRSPSRGPDPLTSTVAGERLGNPTCAERRLRGVAPPPSPDDDRDRCRSSRITSFPGLCSPSRSFRSNRSASRAVGRGAARREHPKTTAFRTTSSVLHPPRSVRERPDDLLAEIEGSDTAHHPEGQRVVAGHQTPIAVPKNDTGREAPAPPMKAVDASHRARRRPEGRTTIEKCPRRSESLSRFTGERRKSRSSRS
jgi:hypothetical protein